MSPPRRTPTLPLMVAAAAPHRSPRGLMTVEARAFAEFDLHVELRRLLWSAVFVLLLLLYLLGVAGPR